MLGRGVLIAFVAGLFVACASATEDPGDLQTADAGHDAALDASSDGPGDERRDEADAGEDASVEEDADGDACASGPAPAMTSTDCYALKPCDACGVPAYIYVCANKGTPSFGRSCVGGGEPDTACCPSVCVRKTSYDSTCAGASKVAYSCPEEVGTQKPVAPLPFASPVCGRLQSDDGQSGIYCCPAM